MRAAPRNPNHGIRAMNKEQLHHLSDLREKVEDLRGYL